MNLTAATNQFPLEAAGIGAVVVTGGERFAFPNPVDTFTFTVTRIDPGVDGDDPLAFPTYLAFDQLTVSFTQTPIPEPASLALFAVAAGLIQRSKGQIA